MFSCVSHFIDIGTVAIKNILNIHTVSTNQNENILHFYNKVNYYIFRPKNYVLRTINSEFSYIEV